MNISYIFQDSIEKQKQKDLDLSRERFKELACVIMEAGKTKICSLDSKALRLETHGESLCCSSNQRAILSRVPSRSGEISFFFFLGLQLTG